MIVLGVDPGISGAFAFTYRGHVWSNHLPVWQPSGKNKSIDAVQLFTDLSVCGDICGGVPGDIFLELGQSMPNQSSSAGFNYGRACGVIEGVLYGAFPRSRIHYVRPGVWKRKMGLLKQPKGVSLDVARRLFPQNRDQFKLKKDHNKAEAALIAYYGAQILTESTA